MRVCAVAGASRGEAVDILRPKKPVKSSAGVLLARPRPAQLLENLQANSSAKPRVNWLFFPIVGWNGDAAAASQTSARGLDMVQWTDVCLELSRSCAGVLSMAAQAERR